MSVSVNLEALTIDVVGQTLQLTHVVGFVVCLVLGLALLSSGGNDAAAETAAKKKRKRKNKKKKKKPAAVEEPVDVTESEGESSSDSEDESEDDVPARPQKSAARQNTRKAKANVPKVTKSNAAAKKKAGKKQKPDRGFQSTKGYNPTPEDTRKRREREAKRKTKQAAEKKVHVAAGVSAADAKANRKAANQAGRITKKGIIGLSRVATAEDKGGNWSSVKGGKKKKKNSSVQTLSADPLARVIVIPTTKVGMVIGSGGLTLRKIEAETGCSIQMPQVAADAQPTRQTRVTITGEDEDMVREAAQCVSDLVNKGHSNLIYRGTDAKQSVFKLPAGLHHILVGKGGKTIKAIQEKSKCKLVLPSDKTSGRVTIIGEKEGVMMVKEALKEIEKYCYCKLADPSLSHEEIEVSATELGYIIGHRGQVIKGIQGDTNTKIYTPGKGRKNKNVIVVGSPMCIQRALTQIRRTIERNTY